MQNLSRYPHFQVLALDVNGAGYNYGMFDTLSEAVAKCEEIDCEGHNPHLGLYIHACTPYKTSREITYRVAVDKNGNP